MRHQLERVTLSLVIGLLAVSLSAQDIKAIWIWEEDTFRMLDDPDWREQVLSRLEQDGFNTLYLYADRFEGRTAIEEEPELYESAIEYAHERGFRVEALLGSAYLSTNRYVLPDKRADAQRMLRRVIAYNVFAGPYARFDAVHLDIEPYALPEWKDDKQGVVEHFADAMKEWCDLLRRESSLEIGAAIPFWFDGIEIDDATLAGNLLKLFDYVALMDYRDKAEGRDGIIEHARREIELASKSGRVVVGVDTGDSDLDKVTFAEEGRAAMEVELGKVIAAYSGVRGYAGIAVHHLASYLALKD